MSEVKRYRLDPESYAAEHPQGDLVDYQDYARLKAEVDMLKANCERMSSDFVKVADDHSALKRQVKQLTLGGDELMEIINGFYCPERGLAHDIWQSAKKGKLP